MDKELTAVIRGAFCLAQPSTAEGYGYPPLEAMACGIPTIVSNIPVLRETTGGNALFADPLVPQQWVEAVAGLSNTRLYHDLTEKGLQWIKPITGQNGWQSHLSDINNLLSTLTG